MDRRLVAAALEYARRGWYVFPLGCRSKQPLGGRGFHDATTDQGEVLKLWRREPEANIGFAPGPSGICIIDVDGPEGEARAQELGLLAEPTLTVLTGRSDGGRHLYFKRPDFEVGNAKLGDHLDVRCDRGYAIVPPSIHPDGAQYTWDRTTLNIGELPPPALQVLQAANPADGTTSAADSVGEVIEEGRRETELTSFAGTMRRRGASADVILAALVTLNAERCQPPLDERSLKRIAKSVARYPVVIEAGPEAPPPEEELLRVASQVLDAPDQLSLLGVAAAKLGYAGDTRPVELVHLGISSRYLARPTNMCIAGPSAGGKTYTVETAREFHPPEAVIDMAGMSERLLAYAEFETRHTFVWIAEAAALHRDGVGATLVRELAWGNGFNYRTIEKTSEGLKERCIERPGPTGLIITSTKDLEPEISTRTLRVDITDAPEQTAKVVDAIAARYAGLAESSVDLAPWHAAQRWLEFYGNRSVLIPYMDKIARRVPVTDVRMRRDFQQVASIIEASALVHQRTRETDNRGRVVADARDYETAYRLLSTALAATFDDVTEETRETVNAVKELGGKDVTYRQLEDELGLSQSATNRRGRQAIKRGYLVNAEERKNYPAKLGLGDPLPDERPVLPHPEKVFGATPPESTHKRVTQPKDRTTEPIKVMQEPKHRPQSYAHSEEAMHSTVHSLNPNSRAGNSEGYAPMRRNSGRGVDAPERESAIPCRACGTDRRLLGEEICADCRAEKGTQAMVGD
ncbi:MAG: bifunctional DNA primase/polymerase [Gemmatimonadota bacterium]|nr:MAG: bifunctional DNA primase/polymerase [Gemmatimonadota bacterium]